MYVNVNFGVEILRHPHSVSASETLPNVDPPIGSFVEAPIAHDPSEPIRGATEQSAENGDYVDHLESSCDIGSSSGMGLADVPSTSSTVLVKKR